MNDIPEPAPGTFVLFGNHLYYRDKEDDTFCWVYMDTNMWDEWDNLVKVARRAHLRIWVMGPTEKLL